MSAPKTLQSQARRSEQDHREGDLRDDKNRPRALARYALATARAIVVKVVRHRDIVKNAESRPEPDDNCGDNNDASREKKNNRVDIRFLEARNIRRRDYANGVKTPKRDERGATSAEQRNHPGFN